MSDGVRWDPNAVLIQEAYTAATLIATFVERELHARGVPSQLFSLLGWIRVLQPVAPGHLSFSTGIPPTTLRDYLRRLVERGDIRRTRNPSDGRSYLVVLTAPACGPSIAAGPRSRKRSASSSRFFRVMRPSTHAV
jgi:MarR family